MRAIAVFFSFLSFLCLGLTIVAGLKAAHGQEFYISHLYWAFASLGILSLTLALCLMFIFKMHSIMHDLIRRLDAKYPDEGTKP
jgi:TRAP-type C4-dicarboxylate transport system permease small subunit